jgi:hypothetical protein
MCAREKKLCYLHIPTPISSNRENELEREKKGKENQFYKQLDKSISFVNFKL